MCRRFAICCYLSIKMVSTAKTIEYTKPHTTEPSYECVEKISYMNAILAYMSFLILSVLGRLQDFLMRYGVISSSLNKQNDLEKSFAPLYSNYEAFYTRNFYRRMRDCFNRPICSSPGVEITLMDRISHDSNWTFT